MRPLQNRSGASHARLPRTPNAQCPFTDRPRIAFASPNHEHRPRRGPIPSAADSLVRGRLYSREVTDERGNYGFRSESIEDPQELRKIADFRRRIRQISLLLELWQKVSESERLADSQLALDDEITAWRHLSSGVNYSLNFASDNLRMLHQIHREDASDPLPFVASYPLARSALEAGALAHWVLAPEDPRERVTRHLRNAARELFEETSLRNYAFDLAESAPELITISRSKLGEQRRHLTAWKKKHSGQIAECARRIGIASPVGGRRVGYSDIVGDATEAAGLARWNGVLVWMQISGLTHPSFMRASARSRSRRSETTTTAQ